jgi:CheY-like chemotaxis protein
LSTILIVDDDPSTRLLLRMIFETDGHAVVEAAHGERALDLMRPDPLPDIVVTDLMMPVLDGLTLIERLQSEPRTARVPIVVVSGNATAALALHTSGRVKAIVKKPFNAIALTECIRAVAAL